MLVLSLGSNIGNFDAAAASDSCAPSASSFGRRCLLPGADLVKPEKPFAYDDPLGVTAAFNKNLLVRMNRSSTRTSTSALFHTKRWNRRGSAIECTS
jgi:uncharacterized SAM-dependent methyltransferase